MTASPDPGDRRSPDPGDRRSAEVPRAPGPVTPTRPDPVVLPAAIRDAIVAAARAAVPDEMCGLVAGSAAAADGGRALRWEPARNAAASPFRFEVAPEDLVRIALGIDDRGEELWGIAHSHVRSPARPSATDIADATRAGHADVVHLVVSLDPADADPATGAPDVRAWWIVGGEAAEARIVVR